MKKIFQLTSILVVLSLLLLSCSKKELNTDQYDSVNVVLQAYGPQPVVRGGTLRFVGSNLEKVTSVIIPADNEITDIEVVSKGVHSEIRVVVPKETSAPGYPVLKLSDGTTITAKTQILYDEPITIQEITSGTVYPGETLTITGDYLNLIHEVIFTDKVKVSEKSFTSHTRYEIKLPVPAEAQTGKITLGTVDETVLDPDSAEDKNLLATLNLVESEAPVTVGTATGTFPTAAIKAGSKVEITGSHLLLTESIAIGKCVVSEIEKDDELVSFTLPAEALDGEVCLVMASGVQVPVGTLTTVVPDELVAMPAPVKNGADLTITGNNLDLVSKISFTGAEGVEFTYDKESGKITVTIPEAAQEGEIVLAMTNGKTVTVECDLVEPVVTSYSSDPVPAGATLTINGTNLDLVASVVFETASEGAVVEVAAESEGTVINVTVPLAAKSGSILLNLKNGAVVEAPEIGVSEAVFAYITKFPDKVHKIGDVYIVTLANVDVLRSIELDGKAIGHLLNGSDMYFVIPAGTKPGCKLRIISETGEVTYSLDNIDPGDRIVTNIWSGSSTVTWGGGAVTALSWGGYDWSTVKPGMVMSVTYTIDNAGGCIRFGNGSWASIPSLAGLAQDGNLPLQEGGHKVVLTAEDLQFLVDNNGFVLCGDGYTVTSIDLIELIPQETTIWSGSSTVTWSGGAVTALSWGGYDWSTVKAGTAIIAHYSIDDPSGAIRFGNGSWASIPSGIPLGDGDGNISLPEGSTSFSITLTEEDIQFLVDNNGFVLCGTGYTVTSIGLLVMPEP